MATGGDAKPVLDTRYEEPVGDQPGGWRELTIKAVVWRGLGGRPQQVGEW